VLFQEKKIFDFDHRIWWCGRKLFNFYSLYHFNWSFFASKNLVTTQFNTIFLKKRQLGPLFSCQVT